MFYCLCIKMIPEREIVLIQKVNISCKFMRTERFVSEIIPLYQYFSTFVYSQQCEFYLILTLNVCRLPCVVWITEFGLLTNMTFPLLSIGWILAAVWITDCWFGWITLCTLNYKNCLLTIRRNIHEKRLNVVLFTKI